MRIITVDTGVQLWERVTGRHHRGENAETMAMYLQEQINFLEDEADMFVLVGRMRDIHLTLDPGQLERFSPLELSNYSSLWWAQSGELATHPYEGITALMNQKLERLEWHRMMQYIKAVLIGGLDTEWAGVDTYYEFPTVTETLRLGLDTYYYRVGELTIEGLMERYTTYQLLSMIRIMAFAANQAFILGASTEHATKDEIAALLIDLTESVNIDPRTYVTESTPLVLHKDFSANLNMVDQRGLTSAIVDTGILRASEISGRQVVNMRDAQHRYIMSQLDNNFWDAPYDWLPIQEQLINDTLYTDRTRPIVDVNYPLYFGQGWGGGDHKWKVYDQRELAELWSSTNTFQDPSQPVGVAFSLRQVSSILLLPRVLTSLRQVIIDLTNSIRWIDPTLVPVSREEGDRKLIKKSGLLTLFNTGVVLTDINVSMMRVEYREFDVKTSRPPIDPLLRSRIRANVDELLRTLLKIRNLDLIWYKDAQTGVQDTTDLMTTVRGQILLLLDANKLGLYETISYVAQGFMTTAIHYMSVLHNVNLLGNEMYFDYAETKVRNSAAFPGNYLTLGDSGML